MKTVLEDISPVKKKLLIEIEASEVNSRIDKAYREVGKKAKIKGFRPGKIPRRILENYFGQQVSEDVTRAMVNETLPKAIEETKIYPLTAPILENDALKTNEVFKYSVVLEVRPEFELKESEYMGLEVDKEKFSLNDETVSKQVEDIRRSHGTLRSIEEDRTVNEEDYAVLNYEGFEGEKALEGIKAENFLLRIGSNDFHPDFEKALIGLKKGETKNVRVDFKEDYFHAELAGKSVDFRVEIADIKIMELPELNDDFARELGGGFNDLTDFETRVREDLIKREEQRIEKELKGRLLKKISDCVEFELPQSLVETEIGYAVENVRQNLLRAGSTIDKVGLKEEKLREEFRPLSEKRVKELLILGEIAKQNDLDVSGTELDDGLKEMAVGLGQDPEVMRRYYEANNLTDSFRQRLLEEKTLNYLIKGAKISEIEASKIQEKQ